MPKVSFEVAPYWYNLASLCIWLFQADLLDNCDHVESLFLEKGSVAVWETEQCWVWKAMVSVWVLVVELIQITVHSLDCTPVRFDDCSGHTAAICLFHASFFVSAGFPLKS